MAAVGKVPVVASETPEDMAGFVNAELAEAYKRAPLRLTNIGGTADAITADGTPFEIAMIGGLQDQQLISLVPAATNTVVAPTLAIDAEPAVVLKDEAGNDLAIGEIAANVETLWRYYASGPEFRIAALSRLPAITGDMTKAVYDQANVAEQLVGLTAAQTLTSKTLTQPTLTLKQGSAPTPTAEGDAQWDTDDDRIVVGDGAGQKSFSDDTVVQARANHTGTQLHTTISDFDAGVQTNRLDQLAAPSANVTMNAQRLTTLADGVDATDAVTKQQLDAITVNISWKNPVRIATTANITLSGEQTIDGVATSADRVLVKNQSVAADNGIYVSAAGAWARATDFDENDEVVGAVMIPVSEGSASGNTVWQLTTDDVITVGSTNLSFSEFAAGGGGGETNTASNLGTGVGTFDSKSGVDLRMRSILGTADETAVALATNDIQVGLADNPIAPGLERILVPKGSTAQRPTTPVDGDVRYNTSTNLFEFRQNGAWVNIPAGGAGLYLQFQEATKTDAFTSSTEDTWEDITGLSVAITPASVSNKIHVMADLYVGSTTADREMFGRLLRGATPIGVGDAVGTNRFQAGGMIRISGVQGTHHMRLEWIDSPATTSATTYKAQIRRVQTGTTTINRSGTDSDTNEFARTVSAIRVFEIAG